MEHFGKKVMFFSLHFIEFSWVFYTVKCKRQKKKKKIKSEGAGKIRELEGKRIIHGNGTLLLPRYPRAF